MNKELRRSMPVFPISTVMQLTDLTARQIRYYEEQDLIFPARTEGNRRLFSLIDIDRLLEIKELLDQGVNMAGIRKVFSLQQEWSEQVETKRKDLSDQELRNLLRRELFNSGPYRKSTLRQGDMSRFFH